MAKGNAEKELIWNSGAQEGEKYTHLKKSADFLVSFPEFLSSILNNQFPEFLLSEDFHAKLLSFLKFAACLFAGQ